MKIKKKTGLYIYYAIGTIIIVLAIVAFKSVVGIKNVNGAEFTSNFADFQQAYNHNPNINDFPNGLQLMDSSCSFSDDNKTYTIEITVKNTIGFEDFFEYQLFFGPEYIEKYASKTQNPFMSNIEDNAIFMNTDSEYTIKFSSLVIASNEKEVEQFKESLQNNIYMELTTGQEIRRVLMPIRFIE